MQTIILFIVTFTFCFGSAAAQGARTEARLLLSHEQARPGQTITAAIELRMPHKTHVYWRNPGQAGLPTEIEWVLPPDVIAAQTRWPVPQKFDEAGLITYGYSGSVILIVPLQVGQNAQYGQIKLQANLNWLECEEACVPGHTNLTANLLIGPDSTPSAEAELIKSVSAQLPSIDKIPKLHAFWDASEGNARAVLIRWETESAVDWVDFFPDAISNCTISTQTILMPGDNNNAQLKFYVTNHGGLWPTQLSGVLVQKLQKHTTPQAWEVCIAVAPARMPELAKLLKMLLLGFLGGLILNVMPCVFPVIALKILGFVKQSAESPRRVLRLGLASTCGVLASFIALAIAVILAQQAGKTTTWGMHMQNPQFTLLLTVLLTLVALNLFGVYEVNLGGRALDVAGRLASRPGIAGAFFNGVLATVLATPCTAPLLAPALGFAFTQPPLVILVMFIAVAAGLALPQLLLSWQPRWLTLLPKPGPWLEQFKVLMGFPILGTAVWLFSFTARRFGPNGPLWLGLFLVILALATWIWGQFVQRRTKHRLVAMALSIVVLTTGYAYTLEKQLHWRAPQRHPIQNTQNLSRNTLWQKWSPETVAKARAEGRPVVVDFTADWCVTCKYNKLVALDTPEVHTMLARINAVALVADNTDEDPTIVAELRKFGRAGVPLVVVYPADTNAPPIVLPTLLTKTLLLDALAKAATNRNPDEPFH